TQALGGGAFDQGLAFFFQQGDEADDGALFVFQAGKQVLAGHDQRRTISRTLSSRPSAMRDASIWSSPERMALRMASTRSMSTSPLSCTSEADSGLICTWARAAAGVLPGASLRRAAPAASTAEAGAVSGASVVAITGGWIFTGFSGACTTGMLSTLAAGFSHLTASLRQTLTETHSFKLSYII